MIIKKLTIWNSNLREVEIERISEEEIKTRRVLRERQATQREIELYNKGYGRLLKF